MIKSKIKIKIFQQHHFPPKFANRGGRIRNSELNTKETNMSLTTSPPKRQQVIEAIAEKIRLGELEPGARLATVRDMSAHFNVSLSVIQGAMRELADDGMIECRGSSGFYVMEPGPAVLPKNFSTRPASAPAPAPAPGAASDGPVRLCCYHHSDLVWRRAYEGYAEVRKKQIDLLLEYFRKYPRFQVYFDQSEVPRVYLADNPERMDAFKRLVSAGRIELLGGMSIPDLNLCSGESLIRNLRFGRDYYRSAFGVEPDIASMEDAFGMCAQLPQVLRKAGYRYLLPGRRPKLPAEIPANRPFNWSGLDGSKVVVAPFTASVSHDGYVFNVPVAYPSAVRLGHCLADIKRLDGNAMACYATEEGLIEEDLFWIVEAANRAGGRLVEFGRVQDFCGGIDPAAIPTADGEFNPTFTGCYTTRIGLKQSVRRAEGLLAAAESLLAAAGGAADLDALWRELILCQFHDGVCGCHTDAANADIRKKLKRVEIGCKKAAAEAMATLAGGGITVFNPDHVAGPALVAVDTGGGVVPDGIPVQRDGDLAFFVAELPPCGLRGFKARKAAAPAGKSVKKASEHRFQTDFFDVELRGAEPMIRSKSGRNVFADKGFGEVLFRDDHGTMWAEELGTDWRGEEFQDVKIEEVVDGEVFVKVVTSGKALPTPTDCGNLGQHWPGFGELAFRKEYLFPRRLEWFKMRITLDWRGTNIKIAVRFPLNLNTKYAIATYDVPFAAMSRQPYFEVQHEHESSAVSLNPRDYATAKGDWPALNWVDYADAEGGLTVANSGTPGHQLVGGGHHRGSLLRSPTGRADGGNGPAARRPRQRRP